MTTLRNIVGGMDLEETLTSRDAINSRLRGVLDEATGKWGIRVNRVELKGIDPPPSIKDSMEKQMRADREKRAVILTAEGQRQAAILTAEGSKQSAILTAEGDRESQILRAQADREAQILRAQGEGQAIQTVFQAIHDGRPDQSLLAYQYLQMMPKIAEGDANKVWIVPSEIGKALEGLGSTMTDLAGIPKEVDGPRTRVDMGPSEPQLQGSQAQSDELARTQASVEQAIAEARDAANPGKGKAIAADLPEEPRRSPLPSSDRLGDGRDPARRGRGRDHQHRGGLGHADHVPDAARAGRLSRHCQRVQHGGAGPGQRVRLDRLPTRAGRTARAGCSGWGRASLAWAGSAVPCSCWCCPRPPSTRSCPVLIGTGVLLVVLGPAIGRRVADRAEARGGLPDHGAAWVWPAVLGTGVYGGYFGAAQGVLLMAILGIGVDDDLQRHNATKNVLALLVNTVAAAIFIVVADVDWVVVALIAVGSVIGGQIGAGVGRRLPPVALRVVIVVVGVVALVALLTD